MAKRRPPARPASAKLPDKGALEPAEQTVISQMPVFDDEAPTPVPADPNVPPRRKSPPSPPKPAPSASAAAPRARSGPPKPKPRGRSLGAAVPARPAAPVPREATFVGLPVGSAPAAPSAPAQEPDAGATTAEARRSKPSPEVAAAKAEAPRSKPQGRLQLPTPGGAPTTPSSGPGSPTPAGAPATPSSGLRSPTPGGAPTTSSSGLRLPTPGGAPATPSSGLRLPTPGSGSGLRLPNPSGGSPTSKPSRPAPGVPVAPLADAPVEPSAPSPGPVAGGVLSFDKDAAPLPGRPVPTMPGLDGGGGGRWMIGGAAAVVLVVVGLFVFGGPVGPKGAADGVRTPATGTAVATTRTARRHTPSRPVAEAPAQPTSAVARAKTKATPIIARRQGRHPMWTKERIAAMTGPNAQVPEFGGAKRDPINYRRPYLDNNAGPSIPMMMIFTKPPGMTIEIDGKIVGRAPLVKPMYGDVQRVEVRVTGAGFQSQKASLRPESDGHFRLNAVMLPET